MASAAVNAPRIRNKGLPQLKGAPKSQESTPKSGSKAMDSASPFGNHIVPGVSVRNGPVDEMVVDAEEFRTNGTAPSKRKARSNVLNAKSYKENSSHSDEDEKPLSKRRRKSSSRAKTGQASDSDDAPLLKKSKSDTNVVTKMPLRVTATAIGESEDSDTPLGVKLVKKKDQVQKRAEKEAKAIRKEEKKTDIATTKGKTKKEESDAKPVPKEKRQVNGTSTPAKKHVNGVKKEEFDDKAAVAVKPSAKKGKQVTKTTITSTVKTSSKGTKAKVETEQDEEAEEDEEEYRWWENIGKSDGTIKWTTLQHNGVVFPPPYEPLPRNVRMLYDGVPVTMDPAAEEVAGFFGGMLNSAHNVENPTFQKNFFEDFKTILNETGGASNKDGNKVNIKEFTKCDFKPIFEHFDAERNRKKALSNAEKKALKAAKDEAEAPYMYCIWDGRKQKVGNFRVEPPALFRGRGEHPKTGRVKKRVEPEQVTINIGKEATVPAPPEGHRWKEIKHDQEGTWLAMWQENINGAYKYVMLAANSDVKGQSDYKKYEKARELKKHIDVIRNDYNRELKSEKMADRQRATAVYLIDQFALRAGNEKSEDEADTVGCCSLKFEHVTLKPPNTVIFDFLGKDSIRFYNEVQVDQQVFKNLRLFKKEPKGEGDDIFDRLSTAGLNKHLSGYMPGLTAKVFRTYNASYTMATLLRDLKSARTVQEKVMDYKGANRQVAILCNHKRTVGAGHAGQMEKMGDRIKGLKYQKWRLKQMMLHLEPKIKKKKGAEFFELEDDLDEDWIEEHQKYLIEEQRTKIEKKFAKDNEKAVADGQKEMKQKELEERLKVADELEKKFRKENKTGKVEAEGTGPSIEKLEAGIAKIDQRIENMLLQAEDKENNKEVALETSKINYIDPRLTVAFSKKFDVPVERFFNKTLREKFDWAIKSADEDWEF